MQTPWLHLSPCIAVVGMLHSSLARADDSVACKDLLATIKKAVDKSKNEECQAELKKLTCDQDPATALAKLTALQPKCAPPQTPGGGEGGKDDDKKNLLKNIQEWANGPAKTSLDGKRRDHCPQASGLMTVEIGPTGDLLCDPQPIPDGMKVTIVLHSAFEWLDLYTVSAKKGEARKDSSLVRGSFSDAAEFAKKIKTEGVAFASRDYGPFGPFEGVEDLKITITAELAGIDVSHTVKVKNAYPINIGVGLTFSNDYDGFELVNKKIAAKHFSRPQDAWVTVQWNAFDWHKVGSTWKHGRYYDERLDECFRRLSLLVGLSVTDPLDKIFVGGSLHIVGGVYIIAGGLYRHEASSLKPGYGIGDEIMGDTVPTNQTRNWTFAAGIMVDTEIAKPIVGLFK